MKTITINKSEKRTGKILEIKQAPQKIAPRQKLVPGKSLEQIRVEAVKQLQELGILI